MKSIAILAGLMIFSAGLARAAQSGDLSCNYAAGNVLLDQHDFDELATCKAPDCTHAITMRYFVSLKHGDAERRQICDSRALWRKIRDGSVTAADFKTNYNKWLPQFFGPDEQMALIDAQVNIVTAGLFRNLRKDLAVRTCEPPRS